MKEYLNWTINTDDPEVIAVTDELPLWSAPFGLHLLEAINIKQNLTVLDLGCGAGFPLTEIAARLGTSSRVYGLDPWTRALERARLKLRVQNIKNTVLISGYAEQLPFPAECFGLIVSNNGINNVRDMKQTIGECFRTCQNSGQLVFTLNLEKTMHEFYSVFQRILKENKLNDVLPGVKQHIYDKRRPLSEIKTILRDTGFHINQIIEDSFRFRFTDGTSMFNHPLIKNWFIGSWKQLIAPQNLVQIFDRVESELNQQAEADGELDLTIPYVTIDCEKR
jgi:ubiquinone/menaquinone biosynthesis C-methylase UbiE